MHTATSFLDLREELPGLTLLEHLHTLLFLAAWSHWVALGLSATLRPPAVDHALFHGFLGPGPWLVSLWVLGSHSLAVLLSSRPFGTCFIQHSAHSLEVSSSHPSYPVISISTSPSESQLSIHPWNPLNSDVTSFKNTQASRENRNHHLQEHIPASRHHLPQTTRMSITLSMC